MVIPLITNSIRVGPGKKCGATVDYNRMPKNPLLKYAFGDGVESREAGGNAAKYMTILDSANRKSGCCKSRSHRPHEGLSISAVNWFLETTSFRIPLFRMSP